MNNSNASLYQPKSKSKRTQSVVSTLVTVVFIALGALAAQLLFHHGQSKQEQVAHAAAETRKRLNPPKDIDDVTTITDVKAIGDSAVEYDYVLHDVKSSQLNKDSLKKLVAGQDCVDSDVQELFDNGIELRYHYEFKDGSAKPFEFSVSKSDC